MNHGRFSAIRTAVFALLFLGLGRFSYAGHDISACQQTCESDCDDAGSEPAPNCNEAEGSPKFCYLPNDLTCSSTTQAAIRLRDGTRLDMQGHTLTCQPGVDCAEAVKMESGSGSKVYNSFATEAVIAGPFSHGVNCALTGGSEVDGIHIDDSVIAIKDCKAIHHNVLTGTGRLSFGTNWGVLTSGVTATSDDISDNYIADKGIGIQVDGTDDVNVHHNVLHTSGFTGCAFSLSSSSSGATIQNNTALGVGNNPYTGVVRIVCQPNGVSGATTISDNVCDPDHDDCATCIDDGYCKAFAAPWTSP